MKNNTYKIVGIISHIIYYGSLSILLFFVFKYALLGYYLEYLTYNDQLKILHKSEGLIRDLNMLNGNNNDLSIVAFTLSLFPIFKLITTKLVEYFNKKELKTCK